MWKIPSAVHFDHNYVEIYGKIVVFPSVFGRFRQILHGQPMGSIGLTPSTRKGHIWPQ